MQGMMIGLMNRFGYLGVFLLIAAENIFPPIPSELILLSGGFMTTYTKLNIFGMAVASTLGSLAGALALYYIGKIFDGDRLRRIVSGKTGKILRLKTGDIDKAAHWFDTKGQKTVFFCRFVPLIRSLISIPAGMSKMAMPKFLAYTAIGSLIWNIVLIELGSAVGQNQDVILKFFDSYSHITVMLLAVLVVVIAAIFYKNRIMSGKK